MSLGDFSQYAEDHARIFVYVTALGETSGALYGAIVDSLQEYPPVRLRGSLSNSFVFVRLANRLPRWARDGQRWQQFQPYKKVAGLLAITQCHDAEDLKTAAESFTTVSKRLKNTLAATKCVVFASEDDLEGATLPKNFTRVEFDNSRSFTKPEVQLNATALNNIVAGLVVSVAETVLTSIKGLRDRLDTGGKMDVLMSPLDGREGENDDETKLSRTQKMGRIHKHMADLYLITGQLQPACDNFCHALSLLSRDPLWEGSANEGLGATLIMKKKHDDIRQGTKTADLSIPSNVFGFLKVSQRILKPRDPSRKRAPTDSTPTTTSPGGHGGAMANGKSSSSFHGRRPRSPLPDTQDDSLDSIEEDGVEAELDGAEEGGVKTDADDEETRKLLQKDLVVDRFTRAELHYRKAGANGGVPRIELLFKFARYLVSQERHKAATEILQKIFWTSGFIDEKDKTTLYQAMAKVFESMGYHRKSSLLLYWAARHATSLAVKLQDYYEAHTLLAQSLPGYKLSIAPANSVVEATNSEPCGWPLLQARLMKELVYLTQHTDQNSLLIQFSCMLLQNLHVYLSETELLKVVQYLDSVTRTQQQKTSEYSTTNSPQTQDSRSHRRLTRNLSSDNLISPLPLSEFPQICTFSPKQFPPHLRPHRTPGSHTCKGPFIVSQLGHWKKEQRPEFLWVVNDSGEISMDITNPLEFELRVENMKLLWEGVAITACPSSLSLPAREIQDFTLTALPQEPGRLELTGYEHTVFGIRSKCSVKVAGNPLIRVVPSLPQLRVHILPQFHTVERSRDSSGSGSIESGTSPMRRGDAQRSSVGPRIEIDMTDGECCEVEFRMMCQKETPVESLSLGIETTTANPNHKPEELCLITCPPPEVVNSLVPFGRKEHRTFVVHVKAKFPTYYRVKNDFVSTLSRQQPCTDQTQSNIVEDGGVSFLTKKLPAYRVASPFRSTAIKKVSGSSASVAKQSLLEQPARQVHGLDSSLPSPTLVDSLNIDVPVRTSSVASYPSSSDSLPLSIIHGISPLPRKKGRGMGVARTGSTRSTHNRRLAEYDEWDFNQFGDLKRASIRSDPGDRKREGSGVLTRSPVSSGGSTPLLKSPSLASQTGSFAGDGELSPSSVSCDGPAFVYEHLSLPRPSRGSPKSPAHRPPVVRKGGSGIKKNNISLPSQLRHNTLAILPNEVAVTARFTLNYSGGDGGKAGYHRQMESSVKVRVHPSLYFDDFGISADPGKMDMFCLSFYVHNKSTRVLYVTCSHNSGEEGSPEQINLRLLPKQKHKVYLSLQRFSLPLDLENSANESKVAQLYSDHLARLVIVQWEQEGDGGRSGVSSLESIRLPSSLLKLIQPIPLLIDLEVNGQELAPGRDCTEECSVGTPVNVKLTLTNNTNCSISPSWLLVDVCEFLGHRISHELTGRMIHSGNLLQRTPQLEPGETYNHQLSFVFFYKGHYQVEFKAYVLSTLSPPQHQQHHHVSSSSSSSSSPSLPLRRTTEETDGGKVSKSYIEQRVTSPILTSCPKSPTHTGESLLEYCGKFGPGFAPLKITPCPFRCKLVPSPAEDVTSAALTSSSQARTEKLLTISEAGEIVKKEVRLLHQESPSLLAKKEQLSQISLAGSSPGLVRRERGIRRHLISYSSVHKQLSHLCKWQVSGPVLSLQVVESRTSPRHRS